MWVCGCLGYLWFGSRCTSAMLVGVWCSRGGFASLRDGSLVFRGCISSPNLTTHERGKTRTTWWFKYKAPPEITIILRGSHSGRGTPAPAYRVGPPKGAATRYISRRALTRLHSRLSFLVKHMSDSSLGLSSPKLAVLTKP